MWEVVCWFAVCLWGFDVLSGAMGCRGGEVSVYLSRSPSGLLSEVIHSVWRGDTAA